MNILEHDHQVQDWLKTHDELIREGAAEMEKNPNCPAQTDHGRYAASAWLIFWHRCEISGEDMTLIRPFEERFQYVAMHHYLKKPIPRPGMN